MFLWDLIQTVLNGLIKGIPYSLLAIGFALVYNTTKLFHIAAAALYVFGAYMFYTFTGLFHGHIHLAGLVAIFLTMGLSLLIDLSVYRPLKKREASNETAMIASIGVMTVIINLLLLFYGNGTLAFTSSIKGSTLPGNIIFEPAQKAQLITGGIVILLVLVFLNQTPWGIRFRALSTNSSLYQTLGYDAQRTRMLVFLLSGALIAVGSCLSVYEHGIDSTKSMDFLIKAMVAMIIGGSGRFGTCVLGGLALGVIEASSAYLFPAVWTEALTDLLFIIMLLLLPQGLAGQKKRTV